MLSTNDSLRFIIRAWHYWHGIIGIGHRHGASESRSVSYDTSQEDSGSCVLLIFVLFDGGPPFHVAVIWRESAAERTFIWRETEIIWRGRAEEEARLSRQIFTCNVEVSRPVATIAPLTSLSSHTPTTHQYSL